MGNLFIKFKKDLQRFGLEWYGRYYGTYKGTVVDNDDPEGLHGLRINVPSIYGKDSPNGFAPPKGIYSGTGRGTIALPGIGDKVWVTFEGGDPRFPIWEYGPPVEKIVGAGPNVDVFQTAGGHRIEVDNTNNFIRLKISGGKTIEVNATGISLGTDTSSTEAAALADTLVLELGVERDRVDKIITAIETALVGVQDGGALYQTNMKAILSTITGKGDFSNVPSKVVTLD